MLKSELQIYVVIDMIVCNATLQSKANGLDEYFIVTKEYETNIEKAPFKVYKTAPIAEAILNAYENQQECFYCNGTEFKIISVEVNTHFLNFRKLS